MEHGSEPVLTVQAFPVDALHTYHRNPRRGVVPAIADSLRVRGQYRPIVVNVGTHTGRPFEILAGNHTFKAASSLGWERIEATTVDVDDEEAAKIVLADNRLADLGGYDDTELLAVLRSVNDLEGTGYTDVDIEALLREIGEPVSLTDPDDVPDVPDEPVSQPGFLWELGPHRLLVGDATDTEAVAAAVNGLVDCVWTDPPYGVEVVGGARETPAAQRRAEGAGTIQNDGLAAAKSVGDGAFQTIAAVAKAGAPVYVAHSEVVRVAFQNSMEAAGIKFRQNLIWVKESFVLSHSDYHYRHEPILFGYVDGGSGRLGRGGERWFGDNSSSTVFDVPRPKKSESHPTMKPVELVERMIRNSCPPGGTVLDLFGGSGSTLIAAHQAGLKAVLVELDPHYADVICKRWQQHTGVVPLLDGKPVPFL